MQHRTSWLAAGAGLVVVIAYAARLHGQPALSQDHQKRTAGVRARSELRWRRRTRADTGARRTGVRIGRPGPINTWTDAVGHGAVLAIDPRTGQQKWKFDQFDVTDSGILTTAGDLLFTGGREGYFHALDARTGALLWKVALGGQIVMGPITYAIEGKQYVSVISGNSLVTFALRE